MIVIMIMKKKIMKKDGPTEINLDKLWKDWSGTTKRKRRPKDEDFHANQETLQAMKLLIKEMKDASRNDWIANKNKQPCIHMMSMCDRVVAELSKKLLHRDYLDQCDLLSALRDWIHPLPDGSLPPLNIRSEIYRIIDKLQLHKEESLQSTLQENEDKTHEQDDNDDVLNNRKGFAKILMLLWSHKDETEENKRLLRKIMTCWIRKLTGANVTHGEVREEQMNSHKKNEILQRNEALKKKKIIYGCYETCITT